jgi:hypothetical protein
MFAKPSLAAIKSVPKLSLGTRTITILYDCHISISYRVAFKRQLFADAGFTVKLQIPLNPPLKKWDFKEAVVFFPLFSRGGGGFLSSEVTNPEFVNVSPAPAEARRLCRQLIATR